MKKVVFNHSYTLRHDDKRSYIISQENNNPVKCKFDSGIVSKIHPVYAMIFSFFSEPIEMSEVINSLSSFLGINNNDTYDLIKPFIDNDKPFNTEYGDTVNFIPTNIIISESKSINKIHKYSPIDFKYNELDFIQQRFYRAPIGLIFMVNNICQTDCLYCYADKRIKRSMLSLEEIEKILRSAKQSKILDINISGGEFFLYKDWRKLIELLLKYNYKPSLISTKIPLTKKDILDFESYNIPLQISLDSIDKDTLCKILNVSNKYVDRIRNTIYLLDTSKIKYQITTVLTKHNGTLCEMESLYSFISTLKHLHRWEIRTAFRSLYSREDFDNIKITDQSISYINKWIKHLDSKVNLLWTPFKIDKYFKSDKGSQHFEGSRCSANYSHMVLLPDGKVTICEQLYWDQRFIIGDLTQQSVSEVWNSKRALDLAHQTKNDFRDDSTCKSCEIFEQCMSFSNRCVADILKAYGMQNLDYPDPRCKKAPAFIYEF